MADLKERIKNNGEEYGQMEFTQVDGKETLRITTNSIPQTASKAILKDPTAFKDRFNGGDILLFTFKLRTVSGGDENGNGKIQIQVEHPETYKKMVADYGENLENIPYGDPYLYRTIFRKYIYKPMYDFFNDPANRDAIIDEYPDFPFDFPDPYAPSKDE